MQKATDRVAPGVHNLTEEFLRETERHFRADGASELLVEFAKAQTIIINSLGLEFLNREWAKPGMAQPFFAEKPDARIFYLAKQIWATKGLAGFDKLLSRSRKGDFESAYYEISTASWFLERAKHVEYNTPVGRKGLDFDLKVQHAFGFDELNVEVKARKKEFRTKKQLVNFVSDARDQVPSGRPAALVINVKPTADSLPQKEMDEALTQCVRSSATWQLMVYFWDASTVPNTMVLMQACVNGNGRCDELARLQ